MSQTNSVPLLGNDITIEIAPILDGSTAEPSRLTFTTDGDHSAGATTITFTAGDYSTGATTEEPAYFTFSHPAGEQTLVATTSDIVSGVADCLALVEDIPSGSKAPLYSILALREGTDFNVSQSTQSIVVLGNDGFQIDTPTIKTATQTAPGLYTPNNAAYKNCESASIKNAGSRDLYLYVQEPPSSAKYSTGTVRKGRVKAQFEPVTGQAGSVRMSGITLLYQSAPTVVDES